MADSKETRRVKMLADAPGKEGATLKSGKTYDVTPDSADWLVRLGRAEYTSTVKEVAEADTSKTSDAQKASDEMTVAELTDDLKARGVDIPTGALKDDLVKLHKKALKADAK